MEPIYGVQIIKTGIFCTGVIAVSDDTVCNSRKCMVAAQPVTKSKGPVCDMAFKYVQQFLRAGCLCRCTHTRWRCPLFWLLPHSCVDLMEWSCPFLSPYSSQGQRSRRIRTPHQDRFRLLQATVAGP